MPDQPIPPIRAVVVDIEGTTTPIAFVHEMLFPYARARLPALLRERRDDPAVAAAVAAIRTMAPGQDPVAVLTGWMDRDQKATPLKALQGLVWDQGYADGTLQGAMYPDVAPALRRWRAAGLRLAVYSSGSVAAQKLLFSHSVEGDLVSLFDAFFDTTTGPKREAASYTAIAAGLALAPAGLLFLSDVTAELDAAAEAGVRTCQLARPQDGTVAGDRHPVAADFDAVGRAFELEPLAQLS